jgi:hypothetical protein
MVLVSSVQQVVHEILQVLAFERHLYLPHNQKQIFSQKPL